jgi:hypothetical protein
MRLVRWSLSALVAALMVAVMATTPKPELRADEPKAAPTAATYVATLDGAPDSARLGLVCDGKSFLAYVCSGDEQFTADAARWFRGECDGKSIKASSPDGRTLTATLTAAGMTGTLTAAGKTYKFTAEAAAADSLAAVYRAEDDGDDGAVVFGWVVDADGFVAGARQQKDKPTTPLKGQGVLNGLSGQAKKDSPPVSGQPVQDPKAPPKGVKATADGKFTAARKKDAMDRLMAKLPRDGNPLFAGMMQVVKRFNSGAKAETKVEERAFAKLKQVPKQVLIDLERNFDKQPKAVRDRMLGSSAGVVDGKTPVSADVVKGLMAKANIRSAGPSGPPQPRAATLPTIEQIKIKELKCNKTTSGLFSGELRDEILAVYAGFAGETPFAKSTGVVSKVKNGDEKTFAAADQVVFPPADNPNLKSTSDVIIAASLFEADPNVKNIAVAVKVLVTGIGAVAAAFFIEAPPVAIGITLGVAALNLAIDQVAANFEGVQPLGDATLVVTVDGKFRNADGNNISQLKYERTDSAGPAPFDYRLKGFDVKVK